MGSLLCQKARAILWDRRNWVNEDGWVLRQVFHGLVMPLISSGIAARAREERLKRSGKTDHVEDLDTKLRLGRKQICQRVEYYIGREISKDGTMLRIKPPRKSQKSAIHLGKKRPNEKLVLNGVSKTVSEWGKEIGISPATLRGRIRMGWPVEKILTTPPLPKDQDSLRIEHNGVTKTVFEWSKYAGLAPEIVRGRLKMHWPMDRILNTPILPRDWKGEHIEYNGVSRTISEWSKETGLTAPAIRGRLKMGWSVEEVLMTPLLAKNSKSERIEYNGVSRTISEWSKETGLSAPTIRGRLKMGWPVEKILTTPAMGRNSISQLRV